MVMLLYLSLQYLRKKFQFADKIDFNNYRKRIFIRNTYFVFKWMITSIEAMPDSPYPSTSLNESLMLTEWCFECTWSNMGIYLTVRNDVCNALSSVLFSLLFPCASYSERIGSCEPHSQVSISINLAWKCWSWRLSFQCFINHAQCEE